MTITFYRMCNFKNIILTITRAFFTTFLGTQNWNPNYLPCFITSFSLLFFFLLPSCHQGSYQPVWLSHAIHTVYVSHSELRTTFIVPLSLHTVFARFVTTKFLINETV